MQRAAASRAALQPARRAARALGAGWCRSAAGTCRCSTRACSRSTARAASTRSCSTCRTSARVEFRGPGARDALQWLLTNDLGRIGPGPRAVHAPARSRRRARRRRHHRVVGRRRPLLRDAERVEHRPARRGRGRSGGARVRRAFEVADVTADARGARGAGAGGADAARGRERRRGRGAALRGARRWASGSSRAPATPARTVSRSTCPPPSAPELWDAIVGGGHHARRTRRARHAATRSRAAVARPRARPGHHAAAGRARLGGALGQGRLPRPRRRSPPNASGGSRAACAASRSRAGARRVTARACCVDGAEVGAVTSGNFSPTLGHAIALAFLRPDVEIGAAVQFDVRGSAARRSGREAAVREALIECTRPPTTSPRCRRCSTAASTARGSTTAGSPRDERRLDAAQVCERLAGHDACSCSRPSPRTAVRSTARSTASSTGARSTSGRRPTRCGSGTSPQRPWVSATHLPARGARGDGARASGADRRRAIPPTPGSGRRCSTSTSRATARSGSSSSTPACSTRASTPSACSRSPCRPSEA